MKTTSPSAKQNVQRTHDHFYLNVDRKEHPKEYFKFVHEQVLEHAGSLNGKSVLDIGCATGEFLHFVQSSFPSASLNGVDVMPDLLERARQVVPKASFSEADISSNHFQASAKYDAVFMLGVHSIFDDLKWLDNSVALLKPGGYFFCFGIFNPVDIDVFIKARKRGSDTLESGWNVISKSTVHDHLKNLGLEGAFVPWSISIPVSANQADPLRSWTVQQADGSFEIRNGLQLVHTFHLLRVSQG